MKILSLLLRLYIYAWAFPLAVLLWASGWKRPVLKLNLQAMGWDARLLRSGFRFRLTLSATRDLLHLLAGHPPLPLRTRPRDAGKWLRLASGPSLFLTGHVHNWELLAGWMAAQGIPLLGAARPLSSPVGNRLLAGLRLRRGIPVVTRSILPRALAHLRAGGCFGVLWDQHSPLARRTSPLFGVRAAMDPLPEILALRCRPRVYCGFLLPSGQVRLLLLADPSRRTLDPDRLAGRFHRVFERVVRAHPTRWYGLLHRRFKAAGLYAPSRGALGVSRETNPDPSQLYGRSKGVTSTLGP